MNKRYKMIISLNALNHLGINLYSNLPAVLSEVIANSYDADATEVRITIQKDKIIINDNGIGMDLDDINNKFLYVGYMKRNLMLESEIYHRKFMGRKGIGKLSIFSIANNVDVYTKKINSDIEGFSMNVDEIKSSIENENPGEITPYYPRTIDISNIKIGKNGTKLILSNIKKNIYSNLTQNLKKRIARRFSLIDDDNFSVYINDEIVKFEDRDYFTKLQYIWIIGEKYSYDKYCNENIKKFQLNNLIEIDNNFYEISGWIGTVANSNLLKDGDVNINKISLLIRGKLAVEDVLNDFSEGGLYSKYLIGEINVDFLDIDDKNYDDIITSSRQDIKKDDARYKALIKKISEYLKVIQKKWTELRNQEGVDNAVKLVPNVVEWLDGLKGDYKKSAASLFGKINQLTLNDDDKISIIKNSILAFERFKYSNTLDKINNISPNDIEFLSSVFDSIDDVEESMYYQIISERLEVIKKFKECVDENDLEKIIQNYLFEHLWLLDPSWERVKGTEFKEKHIENILKKECDNLTEEEKNGRIDLCYRIQSGKHVIIELKRPNRIIKLEDAVEQINKYRSTLIKSLNSQGIYNPDYEFLLIIGKSINADDSDDGINTAKNTLKGLKCRVIKYNELISNAYNSYNEYLNKNQELNSIITLFNLLCK